MAREEGTKSKLVKLLQMVSRGTTPRIGLIPKEEAKVPAMVLVVLFESVSEDTLSSAVAAGADAIATGQADANWDVLLKGAGDKPTGLVVPGDATAPSTIDQCVERGADFVIVDAGAAPASLLNVTKTGKIVTVDESYLPHQVRALGQMSVDAVLAKAGEPPSGSPLTIRDLLHYRQVVDLVHRPVLVAADGRLKVDTLPALRDMGVEGLLLRVEDGASAAQVRDRVAEYRAAIDGLGKSIGRGREHAGAIVPQLGGVKLREREEPEEEPDEE